MPHQKMIRSIACAVLVAAFFSQEISVGGVTTCYFCNSTTAEREEHDNDTCSSDPFVGDESMELACNTTGHNACVKVITTIVDFSQYNDSVAQGDTIVYRGCGYREKERDRKRCKGVTGKETKQTTCYCATDLCNGASPVLASAWMLIMLFFVY